METLSLSVSSLSFGNGGWVVQSVERATPGEEVPGSIPAVAAPTEVMVSQLCLMCGSTQNCQTLCLGARPRNSLVVDEDVKKPHKQTNKTFGNLRKENLTGLWYVTVLIRLAIIMEIVCPKVTFQKVRTKI